MYNSISSQSYDNGGFSGMKDVHEKEALRKHFNETVEKFERYHNDPIILCILRVWKYYRK